MTPKLYWGNLSTEERAEYMQLQMAPAYGGRRDYLPEDCSECTACGYPTLGSGMCGSCYARWRQLRDRLETTLPQETP